MGLTIHYRGRINRTEQIPSLINELEDIAESMGWMSQRIGEDEVEPDFFGIIVNPKGDCEPLCFIFDRLGRLRNLADMITNRIEPTENSSHCAIKTQFTAVETHIWIIGLLRYLKKHYISDFTVSDEGDFWETENRASLIENKQFLQNRINQLGGALESSGIDGETQSIDEMVAHIERIARGLD